MSLKVNNTKYAELLVNRVLSLQEVDLTKVMIKLYVLSVPAAATGATALYLLNQVANVWVLSNQ